MEKVMFSVEEVNHFITSGKDLLIAGDERLLNELKPGKWIGGTIPYFMGEDGGLITQESIYVTTLPDYVLETNIKLYNKENLSNVYLDAKDNSILFIIIPGMSQTHTSFALDAPNYSNFGSNALIGWIAGLHLDVLGKETPKFFNGETATSYEDGAIVMEVVLPENKAADIDIVNIFTQGQGDEIYFPEDGFSATEAFVNGDRVNFADYLLKEKLDTQLPLVADYYGIMVNTSFQSVDEENKKVHFYAPVFKNIEYKHALPVDDYMIDFTNQLPQGVSDKICFSCNCILNFLYSNLEGKKTKDITGPVTFGEIAYQLLNQTMAYVTINDVSN